MDAGWIPTLEWRHGAGRGTLQAGLAARFHTGREWGETVWAASFPPGIGPNPRWYDYDVDKTTWQPFLQETWRLAPDWSLLAGVTWTSHTYDLSEDRVGDADRQLGDHPRHLVARRVVVLGAHRHRHEGAHDDVVDRIAPAEQFERAAWHGLGQGTGVYRSGLPRMVASHAASRLPQRHL